MTSASATLLAFDEIVDPSATTCVVIGYAGRDADAVQAHIDELAAIGVAPPPQVPMVYPMPTSLLTSEPAVVASPRSSGEVEPVLVRAAGRVYLGVGSDHTDRELETEDILRSKLACPKPTAPQLVEIDPATFAWDACRITCTVDGREIQTGGLDGLRPPANIFALLDERGVVDPSADVVVFGGTVPLIGGEFVYGRRWTITLTLPDGRVLEHTYETQED